MARKPFLLTIYECHNGLGVREQKGHPPFEKLKGGGGRHGGAYYKISTSTNGKMWVVEPETFKGADQLKGTVINGVN